MTPFSNGACSASAVTKRERNYSELSKSPASPSRNTARQKSGAGFSPFKKNPRVQQHRTLALTVRHLAQPVPCRQIKNNPPFKNRKAQVSIFIFIAVLVVLLVGFFSIVGIQGTSPSSSPAKSAKQFVEMCFNEASECALYAAGKIGDETIPDIVDIQETSQTSIAETSRVCLGSNHFSQDVAVTAISPAVAFTEKTKITAIHDIVVRQENEEITIDNYKETFDVPFKELYAEAVQLKSGSKPEGVPDSYIKLDSSFDVDVAEQDGQKIISLAGGELKKQYYRFNVVK